MVVNHFYYGAVARIMNIEERMELITRNTIEVIDRDSLRNLLEQKEHPKIYVGFEPSGLCHFGWKLVANKIIDYYTAELDVTILFADWHAQINGKLNGNIDNIRLCAEYMKDSFESLGVDRKRVNFVYANDYVGAEYLQKILEISSRMTVARTKRAMTIMGRKANNDEIPTSMMIYPSMQAADIFQLKMDIAYGGLDQRRIHMLARDICEKTGWTKPVAIHTPLVPGLKAMDRMNPQDSKMSKSKPDSGILIHDSEDEILKKMKKAFCPPPGEFDNSIVAAEETDNEESDAKTGNPVLEIARLLLFNEAKPLRILRPEKYGGEFEVADYSELEKVYNEGLNPLDLKISVGKAIADLLKPSRDYFEKNPDNYLRFKKILSQ